ncbi:B3/B4 domain-containing protein [Priestia endophytica]|jgi:DNA/RNA-binding domain of Phe-tRNA-synthetase-like protein|uniref:B3/B4 domain-containing protein n=1 Tax=Priestia endophytica TaxID=135735 RepID=UPI002E202089|nr:phenylalanine--tRNA ligase beta subunit-related protein [Priestia endophytica]MED4073222.1 phenylalanine--tRNA ligase beta subunit-related protein [Priestia endophytica]
MEIKLSNTLIEKVPGFKVGVIQYNNIEIGESPQMLRGRLQLFQESIHFDLQDKNVTDFEGIKEWRQVFKTVGTDPSRYRPSIEALYRRIKKHTYLQPVHSGVDLNNFFSLEYQVPIGLYDFDALEGDILITIGDENAHYEGLNGRNVTFANSIVSLDNQGAFGSPYVDSVRTKVTETTKNALQIVYLKPSTDLDNAERLLSSLQQMFNQIHGGEGKALVIA